MSQWSVIVYSRTYEADYRLLAIPQDFTPEDEKWAINYIKATTKKPEQLLPCNARWSLFKNHKHCVIGVTCMVQELISDRAMTVDKGDRPIHAFVGYVTKVDKNQYLYLDIPYHADQISLFKDAYNFVKDQWLVKPYQLRINFQTPRFFYDVTLCGRNRTNSKINPDFCLNMNDDREVRLWQNSHGSKWGIWESACLLVDAYQSLPLSLCLGMPTEKDVLESPFFNATVPSVNTPKTLKRVNHQVESANCQKNKKNTRSEGPKKKLMNRQERICGVAIGVVIWGAFLFQWMVIAIIIGGIVGGIVVFLLQKSRGIKTKFCFNFSKNLFRIIKNPKSS